MDTHAIFKYGIEDRLPDNTMIHGPAARCVILWAVDDAISIAPSRISSSPLWRHDARAWLEHKSA